LSLEINGKGTGVPDYEIGIIAVAAALPRLLPYWTLAGTVRLYACHRDKDPRRSINKSVSAAAAAEEAVLMEVASLVVVVVVDK
jgi:hypothetical protein